MAYLGSSPGLVSQRLVNTFTATAGQTTFTTTTTYVVNYVDVYVNGVKLNSADYTATNTTTVVLAEACTVGDIVDILLYFPRGLSDGYTKSEADTRFQPLDGPLVVSANTSSNALRITQTGTGNALLVEDSANPDASPFVVTADGNVLVNATNSVSGLSGIQSQVQINNSAGIAAAFVRYSSDSLAPSVQFLKSRNATYGSQTVVNIDDGLGTLRFVGSDGTNFIQAASIASAVDGTPGTNDMPGRLVFSTTADGASSPTERMRIDSAGNVGIGGTTIAGFKVSNYGNLSGAATAYSYYSGSTFQSDVTTNGIGFGTFLGTQAASFTLTSLTHFRTAQGTFGASSTVTNQFGFEATNTLTGATNNFGFYSNIASGTGRWNFYASGTADNYFAGNVGIGLAPVANNGILQLGSYGSVKALMETATVSATAATGTINYDAATQAVLYYTSNATANWTLNIRGSSTLSLNTMMATGQSLTVVFIAQQGATAYYPTALQVDGTSITPKWQGGTAPSSGNTNSIDVYSYTIVKTASATFTVFASQAKFA